MRTRHALLAAVVPLCGAGFTHADFQPLLQATGPRTFFTARLGLISGTRVSVRELAAALSRSLDREVRENTGLLSVRRKVEWAPDSATGDFGVSLFTALQEQLGVKLESTKAPVDVLVIEHVERPVSD